VGLIRIVGELVWLGARVTWVRFIYWFLLLGESFLFLTMLGLLVDFGRKLGEFVVAVWFLGLGGRREFWGVYIVYACFW
jgi:hypothetical protein